MERGVRAPDDHGVAPSLLDPLRPHEDRQASGRAGRDRAGGGTAEPQPPNDGVERGRGGRGSRGSRRRVLVPLSEEEKPGASESKLPLEAPKTQPIRRRSGSGREERWNSA